MPWNIKIIAVRRNGWVKVRFTDTYLKPYLNTELYASREVTLAHLGARRLFTFQWQQERENSLLFFGPGLDSTLHSRSKKNE